MPMGASLDLAAAHLVALVLDELLEAVGDPVVTIDVEVTDVAW